jgi:signal transduction histidine kinase
MAHQLTLADEGLGAVAAILDERTRIARELHDTVAQTLYAITLSASRALKLVENGDPAPLQRLVEDVIKLANDGQAELRTMLSSFRSEFLIEHGLTGALTGLAADAQARYGLNVQLALGDEPDISPAAKEALARIAQEALHNVAKHAEADRVDLVLNVGSADDVVLLITDTGRGFDPQVAYPGHFGLQSMRERARAAGGSLDLISAVGYGTLLRVRVPRRG